MATQNTAKITLDWLKANLMGHCPRKSGLPAQINTEKVILPQKDNGFCDLVAQKTAKIT
jgi:hypothetical protein